MREQALGELAAVVGDRHVIVDALEPFAHDATFMDGELIAAVLPGTTSEVSDVMRVCHRLEIPVVARGAGTSLVGGIVLSLERMDGIEIDTGSVCAIAGAGAITSRIQEQAGVQGLMYPPDPASAQMSSIGGNVACNSGGPSCLKYGVTADYGAQVEDAPKSATETTGSGLAK